MAYSTRKSRMAIVAEVTSGTPVAPSSGAEFIGLQDGFSLSPSFETLENAELSSSVGAKAPILGNEAPEGSVSHYLRHSGTEGTAPNYDLLIKGALGDKVAAHVTERSTTTASTAGTSSAAAIVKLAAGGSDFERGKAILLKDATNGYAIRNVQSVSSNDLTLGFNLTAAPASGVPTGRAVLYKPADAPPTMSAWVYWANEAAVELMAGARVSEMSIEATANEILNASFNFAGTGYYFDPIEITSSTRYIDFTDDAGTFAATVAVGMYKDPHALASALETALNAASTEDYTVVYSDADGKFTIASATTAVLSLLWNTGTNAANTIATKIGFSAAANSTGALTYTSANALNLAGGYTPVADANINPIVVKNAEVMIGDFDDFGCSGASAVTITVSNELGDVADICEESGIAEKILNGRVVTAEVELNLSKYDADKFRRFRQGADIRFAFNAGVKEGGNWVAGRCVNAYMPQAKISAMEVVDGDSIVKMNLTIQAYVGGDGLGEFYINFL